MEKARILGGSNLEAPNVQELTKELATVPQRYIHDDIETITWDSSMLLPQIPVIDMEKLLSNDHDLELQRLHLACQE